VTPRINVNSGADRSGAFSRADKRGFLGVAESMLRAKFAASENDERDDDDEKER
jgi:hypothetical protein